MRDGAPLEPDAAMAAFRDAESAAEAGDWNEAARGFTDLATRAPDFVDAWVLAQRMLRQSGQFDAAANLADAALRVHPTHAGVLMEAANTAEQRRDIATVRRHCALVRQRHPMLPDATIVEMRACRAAGLLEVANELGREARASGLDHPAILLEAAAVAFVRQDHAGMEALCARLREVAPLTIEAYLFPLRHAVASGDFAGADRLLAQVPRAIAVHADLARCTCLRFIAAGEMAQALAQCRQASIDHPNDGELHGLMAFLLRETGAAAAGEEAAGTQMTRFPREPRLAFEHAMAAEARGDPAVALTRWQHAADAFPHHPDPAAHVVRMLLQLGRLDEAEMAASRAHAAFPDDRTVFFQFATVASARCDWPLAVQRWQEAAGRFPEDAEIVERLSEAQATRALQEIGVSGATRVVPTRGSGVREMLMRFESLGDNCDFGLVQRAFGAEPLGLLRWASTYPARIAAMLENGLQGVGEAANVELELAGNGEYMAGDPRYFTGHTYIRRGAIPESKVHEQATRRICFLRDKLADDLAEGEKVFVYRTKPHAMDEALMHRLHAAIRRYGGARLFIVLQAPELTGHGEVRTLRDGLHLGHIVAPEFEAEAPRRHLDTWVAMCRRVAFPK